MRTLQRNGVVCVYINPICMCVCIYACTHAKRHTLICNITFFKKNLPHEIVGARKLEICRAGWNVTLTTITSRNRTLPTSPETSSLHVLLHLFFFKRSFFKKRFYLFLERGEGREKERERNTNVWLPLACALLGTSSATQACALAWESNRWPFGLQAGAQFTQPPQQGPC